MIYWFLACAEGKGPQRSLMVTWRECKTAAEFGQLGRRFSGFKPWSTDPDTLPGLEPLAALAKRGTPPWFIGRSPFSCSKVLRHLARAGLPHCYDIDTVNAHPTALHKRHPAAPLLRKYVTDRDAVLADTMAQGVCRDVAKELYLRVLYAGKVASWERDHGAKAPDFAHEFAKELAGLRALDAAQEPSLYQKAKDRGHARPEVLVQVILNNAWERMSLDLVVDTLGRDARVMSYEHDGIFCAIQGDALALCDRAEAATGVKLAIKRAPTQEEAFAHLRAEYPSDRWDDVDADWRSQMDSVRAVMQPGVHGKCDQEYAKIVASELQPYNGCPWSVRELFKYERGRWAFFDVDEMTWAPSDSDRGRNELLLVMGNVLQKRCVSDYHESTDEHEHGGCARCHRSDPDITLGHAPLLEHVEKLLRGMLHDPNFGLDGEDTRPFLRFKNVVYNAETDDFAPNEPRLRVTNSMGWKWEGSGLTPQDEGEVAAALQAWRATEAAVEEANRLPPDDQSDALVAVDAARAEVARRLEALKQAIPDLGFLHSLVGTWERVFYTLRHQARSAFALPYQECLAPSGPGCNGKSSMCTRMEMFLGRLAVNLLIGVLCLSVP